MNLTGFCYSYVCSFSSCAGKTSICMGLITKKFFGFLVMFLTGCLAFSVLLLYSLSIIFFLSICIVFDAILCNINNFLLINPSANVFVFGDFNVNRKDWLTYSGRTDRCNELCYDFSISNDLTHMLNSPTRISHCDSHNPALLN